VTGRRGRRRRKLLDDLKERRGYCHLKEEALDRSMWRARCGRGFRPVVRQTAKWMMNFYFSVALQLKTGHGLLILEVSRHTTLGRTPLDEWSARRRDLYLTIHNTHKWQTSMPPAGFEPANPKGRAAADLCLRSRGHREHTNWELLFTKDSRKKKRG
jgi:hypothetical protein